MDLLGSILETMEKPPQTTTKQEIMIKSNCHSVSHFIMFVCIFRATRKSQKDARTRERATEEVSTFGVSKVPMYVHIEFCFVCFRLSTS